jgi:hypothetical protein
MLALRETWADSSIIVAALTVVQRSGWSMEKSALEYLL